MAAAIFVMAAAGMALAAPEDARFHGGSYDGWHRDAISAGVALALIDFNDRFHGGSYDGWHRNAMSAYATVTGTKGTLIQIR
jgi:hypothetical protein